MLTRTSALALLLVSGQIAAAQVPDPVQAGTEDETRSLEKVVVTARKQEEAALDTPLSITAFTSETLINQGISDPNAIALRTPGMVYANFGDSKLSPTSLRGVVGGAGSAGTDPAVGYYLDEVFIGQGVGAAVDLFDLAQVEVLRGPQGTLFGRNAIGGAVSYTTARPTDEFEARLEIDAGNYDYYRIGGVISGPIVPDRIQGRLAIVTRQRVGFYNNVLLGQDVNTQGSWPARGQLAVQLGGSTDLLLSADYKEIDQRPLIYETLSYTPGTTFAAVSGTFGIARNTDPFDRNVYADITPEETAELWGMSSTFSTRIGAVDVINITSYREHDYFSRTDTDRSSLSWIYDGDPETVNRFSNELRLSGTSGALDWIAGLYYFDQETSNQSYIEVGSDLAAILGAPQAAGLRSGSDAVLETTSTAAFASLTWAISEQLDLTVGGRYTQEDKSIDYTQSDALGLLGGNVEIAASDSWSKFTPTASLRYRFTPQAIGYVTVSSGFKSGGFNDALGDANGISFDPESLWNYEAGFKGEFFGGSMQASLAAFHMDWTDIQINADNPDTPLVFDPTISNAGGASSTGLEVEILARLSEYLTVGVNGSLLDSKYEEGSLLDGTPLDRTPYAPDYTFNLTADYVVPISSSLNGFAGGAVLARGKSYLTLDNQEDGRVDSYALLNLNFGIEARDGRWRLSVWGSNLGDETVKHRLFDLGDNDIIGQKFIMLNDPTTYGVRLVVRH